MSLFTNPLVSVDWLYVHLNDKNLIVLDATIPKVTTTKTKEIKRATHIKNSVFFDLKNTFSNKEAQYPNTILSPKEFEKNAQKLGVKKDSCIVVYDAFGIYSSARVWWMFRLMGFNNIAVLNGGLPAWKKMKYPLVKAYKKVIRIGDFKAVFQPNLIKFKEDILNSYQSKKTLILDARSSGRFNATQPEPRKEVKSGHIPNSKNLPYTSVLIDDKLKPKNELESIFNLLADKENEELIFSCGTGITACVLALAAEVNNLKNYAVYDGSWTEWASKNEKNPIENKSEMKQSWSKKEFETFVLLFAAHCNFIETKEESEYILTKVDEKTFNKIHTEIVLESESENLLKIKDYLQENNYSLEDKDNLIRNIKAVFFADGTVDILEKNIFQILKKTLF